MPPRQAIFGGTFDPPHVGHVAAACSARDQLGIDVLHVIVANDPWQKSAHRAVTAAHHRLAMAQLAFGDLDKIVVSDVEIRRGGPSYTIETVSEIERPGSEALLVLGASAANGVTTWHRARELAERVGLAIVQPPGEPPIRVHGWRTEAVRMDAVEVSATAVRRLLAGHAHAGMPPEAERLVPSAVLSYVVAHRLYSR